MTNTTTRYIDIKTSSDFILGFKNIKPKLIYLKLSKILPTCFFVYNPQNRRKGNHPSRTTLVFSFYSYSFPTKNPNFRWSSKNKNEVITLFSIVWFKFYGSIFNRQNENQKIDKSPPKMISLLIYKKLQMYILPCIHVSSVVR